ncbi:MAG: cysteine synthase A [Deltaproteobacteria bacterium]|jgi:cysteine synthase A
MHDRIYDSVLDLIGHTPLVRLRRLSPPKGGEVIGKLENLNPAGSVKDRPALQMILDAEARGELREGATIIEATSGNTGISLAMIAAVRGYQCVLVMPEDMSIARRQILQSYGAEVVLTTPDDGMAGAVERAEGLLAETKNAFMPRQFSNPSNPDAHAKTTAEEIWRSTDGKLDAFVVGVGTGGTLSGVARVLKQRHPALHVVAVEPRGSAVLSGGKPGLHGIQGLGAGFVPEVLDRTMVDEIVTVNDVAAERAQRRLAREEGLFVGTSAGANVHAAVEVAKRFKPGTRIVTILCDGGERYLR